MFIWNNTILVPLLLGLACNEYEIKPHNTPESSPEEEPNEPETVVILDCPILVPDSYVTDLTTDCIEEPVIGEFNPIVEWSWDDNPVNPSYNVVEAAPIAINLNDDNGDGFIDDGDNPDIIFPAFKGSSYRGDAFLIALSGTTHTPIFAVESTEFPLYGISGIAAGDVDRDGLPDIFAVTEDGVMRLDNLGNMVWHVEVPTTAGGESIISLGDLDADGLSEIILGGAVIHADGYVIWEAADNDNAGRRYFGAFAADLDQDGFQEVVSSSAVFEYDGTLRWEIPDLDGYPALGDLDGDLLPEIISTYNGVLTVLSMDGVLQWTVEHGVRSGPPTIADFDGDGEAEIGVASKLEYTVFDGDGTPLWSQPTQEASSGMTGSSVFDFEGDGAAEVVYGDEENLWIFDGATGSVEMSWSGHDSGTRFEYPTIVDIDLDGSAEILLPGGRGASFGLSVIGSEDNSWAPARPIWNQYAYAITNINDDGTIPTHPEANWLSWNNFRAGNSETKVGLELPDLQLGEPELCLDECSQGLVEVYLPVENTSLQEIHAGLSVQVYVQNILVHFESILFMNEQSVYWVGPILLSKEDYENGVSVFVDTDNLVRECLENNNLLLLGDFPCNE